MAVSFALDRARRHAHEAANALKNARAFLARHEGDPERAASAKITLATLPSLERRVQETTEALAALEAAHSAAASAPVPVHMSFVFHQRTTPYTEQELADWPELPAFLDRRNPKG